MKKLLFGLVLVVLVAVAMLVGTGIFFLTQTWHSVVLLQNSDEVRATGGFLGSLAFVQHQGLKIKNLEIIDIYELDSQISRFPPAPAGVQAYLSGGVDALHLQDANWDRDFPTSAQRVIKLLQEADREAPDFVVAINASLIQNYLQEFGAVTATTATGEALVSSENFTKVARQDHEIFNPNRVDKAEFLTNFSQTLRAQWSSQGGKSWWQLWKFGEEQLKQRQIQVYGINPLHQLLFANLGWTGELRYGTNCQRVYFVESNVGINKSNAHTSTTWEVLPVATGQAHLQATITNANQYVATPLVTKRLHYANYQRLLLPPDVALGQITIDGEATAPAHRRTIYNSRGQAWEEYGWLMMVAEEAAVTMEADLYGSSDCWQVVN